MTETMKGLLAMLLTCIIWGLSGLYYNLINFVPAIEVLAHRTIWSVVFLSAVLIATGRLHELRPAFGLKNSVRLTLAAATISINWFFFIWSVQNGHAIEASFGYYVFPLVAVLFGFLIFGERLSTLQSVAIALAVSGVTVLGVGLGITPWIAIILATTFGTYGILKKGLAMAPVTSVLVEVIILAPFALAILWVMHYQTSDSSGYFGTSVSTTLLLMFAGVITAVPLMLFSYATQRLRMAAVGLMQYLNPTLQFCVASIAFLEPVTRWHIIALIIIWIAIALYSLTSFRKSSR